jgi:RecA/RadA recombinase
VDPSLTHSQLQVPQRDVQLIILDSIAALLRTADLSSGGGGTSGGDGGPAALAARGEALGLAASVLKAVAESNRIPVVVTNQVGCGGDAAEGSSMGLVRGANAARHSLSRLAGHSTHERPGGARLPAATAWTPPPTAAA